jgi:hypothetical protein
MTLKSAILIYIAAESWNYSNVLLYSFFGWFPCPDVSEHCSETSVHRIQKPGNHPKERTHHPENVEILKWRILSPLFGKYIFIFIMTSGNTRSFYWILTSAQHIPHSMCMIPPNYFIVSRFYKLSQKSFNTSVKFQPNVLYISFNSVMPEWLV